MPELTKKATPLLDEIYKMLTSGQERAYSHGLHSLTFQVYMTDEQLHQLMTESVGDCPSPVDFKDTNDIRVFGEKVIIVQKTPYIRLVEGLSHV